jgi:hypothetical protein
MSIIIRVHPQYSSFDGMSRTERAWLRRQRRAVARQTYIANAGLRSALRAANRTIATPPLVMGGLGYGAAAYGQSMLRWPGTYATTAYPSAYGYGSYGTYGYPSYTGAYAGPGYAYAGALGGYQAVVSPWSWF